VSHLSLASYPTLRSSDLKETLAVKETLTAALGRTPGVDEIASALGVDRETAVAGLSDAARVVSTLDEATAEILVADTALPEETLDRKSTRLNSSHVKISY